MRRMLIPALAFGFFALGCNEPLPVAASWSMQVLDQGPLYAIVHLTYVNGPGEKATYPPSNETISLVNLRLIEKHPTPAEKQVICPSYFEPYQKSLSPSDTIWGPVQFHRLIPFHNPNGIYSARLLYSDANPSAKVAKETPVVGTILGPRILITKISETESVVKLAE